MQPISLKFSGLNSYRGEADLDFSPMSSAGVFGIFGPTGAGKSTILDAITLALYGEVTRSKNKAQGVINMAEKQAMVSFSFKLGGNSYEVQRVLIREKGKDFSAKVKSCRLTRLDDNTVLASDKAEEVNQGIIDLIGLRSEDFLRSVALPQGQFDKFLRLGASDRGKMLEHLFGLEQYGVALQEKVKLYLESLEQQQNANQFKLDQMGDCSKARLTEEAKVLAELEAKTSQIKNTLSQENTALQKWEILNAKAEEYKINQAKQAAFEQEAEHQKQMAAQLELAQKTEILRQQINQIQTELTKLKNLESQIEAANQELAKFNQQQTDLESTRQALAKTKSENYEKWLLELQNLETQQTQASKAEAIKSQLTDTEKTGINLENQEKQLLQQQHVVQTQIAANLEATTALDQEIMAEKTDFMAQNLAVILGSKLGDDQPCPVCGSLHHPKICQEQSPDLETSLLEIKKAKLEAEAQNLVTQQQALQTQALALAGDKAANTTAMANLKQNLAEFGPLKDSKTLAQAIANLSKQKTDLLKQEEEVSQKLATLAPGVNQKTAALNLLLGQKQSTATAFEELKIYLSQECAKLGFDSVNQAKLALRTSEEQAKLSQEISQYQQGLATVAANLKTLSQHLEANHFMPEQGETLKASIKICIEAQEELLGQTATQKQLVATIAANQELWQKLLADNKQLAADAHTGKDLQNIIKGGALVNFLAEEYLNQVLIGANAYLETFSNGRYGLELDNQSQSKGKEFMLQDSFNGGQSRPLNTMSGGEIFLASLSMALALSTHIQLHGKYELGFFFLDEGFGTLDPEKLDTLMSAMEKLPAGGRLVGIITHVAEVKNRLPYYWQVSPATPGEGSKIDWHTN